jgi:YggT family protein
VESAIGVIGVVASAARQLFFAFAAFFALICLIDWLVRTRRVSPFSGIARFFRSAIDPIMAPIERRVVAAGGLPSAAPWWTLVAVVVAGLLIITALDFLTDELRGAAFAASQGAPGIYQLLISWTFGIFRLAILITVLASWVPISRYSPWLRWAFVLSEPILKPLRQILPSLGPFDISPIVAFFLLGWIQGPLMRLV